MTEQSVARTARTVVLALSLLGICAAIGFAAAANASQRQQAPADGAAKQGIVWHGCGKRLQCATVRVPLNWDHPHGRNIKLAVIRHLASRPGKRIGSLFFNPGGPGNSGVEFVTEAGALLDTYSQGRFNVVSWDPRGTNASTHVRCFKNKRSQTRFWKGVSIPTTKLQSQRYRRKTAAYARRCGKLSGWLLPHVSTADQARDLDYLRRLVGDRRLTYYGVSYGAFLGQTYANMFPGRVRAMAIDGVVDPVAYTNGSEAAIANITLDSDRVFEQFQSLCQSAGPERCALAGHGPVAARVDELMRGLRRAPIAAPSASPPGKLTYGDVLVELFSQLGHGPASWPHLAQELNRAAEGDGSELATSARQAVRIFRASSNGDGFSAMWCADSPARQGSRAWPRVIRRLTGVSWTRGPVLGWWAWGPCASWSTRDVDRYAGPWNRSTKNPILVMGIRNDPNTTFANARRAVGRLGNAVLLTQQGYGHGTYSDPSACVEEALGKYFVHLVTPRRGKVCPSDRQPFDPNFGKPLP